MKYSTIIGIDPAFRQNGFAICILDVTENSAKFKTFKTGFIEFFFWVLHEAPVDAFWAVENSNLQNNLFSINRETKNVAVTHALSVGKNMAASQLVCDFLKAKFNVFSVQEISPREKGAKITDVGIFKAYSRQFALHGYKGLKGEQDARDAFKIANLALAGLYLKGMVNKTKSI